VLENRTAEGGNVPVDEGPTLRRRRLGAELRRCRETAGMTQEQVSRRFEWHSAKVNRIETARVSVTPRDVRDLLNLYDVRDDDYRESLLKLARSSREKAWWAEYREVVRPDSFIAMESEATSMRNWEPDVVPGLLQTEGYMRALFSVRAERDPDRAVTLRLTRQRRLTGDDPIDLFAIIDESVIHRLIGGPHVMADQLRHLLQVAELPSVTLRILPYAAGQHPFLGLSMAVLEFRDAPELNVVYVESFDRQHYIREQAEVTRYCDVFERLARSCLDEGETVMMIKSQLSG
jgi:transcriptional regulator with XRE-family HTH domain